MFAVVQSVALPRSATLHHAYGAAVGLWSGWVMFGFGFAHVAGTALAVYVLVKYVLPRAKAGPVIFALTMAYVVGCHSYRM